MLGGGEVATPTATPPEGLPKLPWLWLRLRPGCGREVEDERLKVAISDTRSLIPKLVLFLVVLWLARYDAFVDC